MEADIEVWQRYLDNAKSQLSACEVLNRDYHQATHFLGPILLLLGFAVEIFLKSVLLRHGCTPKELKGLGHDLNALRERSEECLPDLRHQAVLWSEHLTGGSACVPRASGMSPAQQFERDLASLAKLHADRERKFALRYPTESFSVPDPTLLIGVFEGLLKDFESGSSLIKVP